MSCIKAGEKLRSNRGLSYIRLRELFKLKLGYDSNEFGLHSLRAGGATVAANVGVEDRLFKRNGRWVSDKAKDGYVLDALEWRLLVSKSLLVQRVGGQLPVL